MKAHTTGISALLALGLLAGGCASDGGGLNSTASVAPVAAAKVAMAPKVDPVCVSLNSQIDNLRKESAVGALEKAATGKAKIVKVKRSSLAKQAELNKANADFQAKCGPAIPTAQTAQAAPAAAVPAATVAAAAQAAPLASTAAAAATTMAKDAAMQQVKGAATTAAQTAVQAVAKP
jgi:hypothetical protein